MSRGRVLVTNVYSYENKGDAAIVVSLLREVRRVFASSAILVQTTDTKNDEGKYGVPVSSTLLWILLSSVRSRKVFTRLWVIFSGIFGLTLYLLFFRSFQKAPSFLLSRQLQKFVKEVQDSGLVIACGGGYLRTSGTGIREMLLLYVTCLNFLAAAYLGKPVYLYSQSIGPVHGRCQTRLLRFVLNKVNLIEAREDVSYDFLKRLKLRTKVIQTADPALMLGDMGVFPKKYAKFNPKRLHVGITVRKWFKNQGDMNRYMQSVADTIDFLIERYNAEVFYVPQVIARDFGDDDRLVAKEVYRLVEHKDRYSVIDADLRPVEIIGLCGGMDIFIGTRMHSNIFALINAVPVIAIEYEHKTKGIMRGLDLEAFTIDIRKVTFATLKSKVVMLLKKREECAELIRKNLPKQIEKSRWAIEVIKEDYETTQH